MHMCLDTSVFFTGQLLEFLITHNSKLLGLVQVDLYMPHLWLQVMKYDQIICIYLQGTL